MNFGILEALLIPEIVTEADDITKQVNDIMGGKKAPAENRTEDQREEDLTQTDNIFDDIQKDDAEDNPQNNPTENTQDENSNEEAPTNDQDSGNDTTPNMGDDNTDPNDDMGDNSDDLSGDGTEDPMNDDPDGSDEPGMSPEDKSIFSDKNTLKKNMIYFFNIMRYTITSLEESLGSTEDQETLRVINSVIHNLYAAKDVLYDILTKRMETTPYEVLTTKYITLKRIYDISCDMLEEHFKQHPNKSIKYKRFKNKAK